MHSYKFESSFRQQTNKKNKNKNGKNYVEPIYWHLVLNI